MDKRLLWALVNSLLNRVEQNYKSMLNVRVGHKGISIRDKILILWNW